MSKKAVSRSVALSGASSSAAAPAVAAADGAGRAAAEPRESGDPTHSTDLQAALRTLMGRRQALGKLAWVASVSPFASSFGCGSEDEAMDADPGSQAPLESASAGEALQAPDWDAVPTCVASNADGAGQGPFFIHDAERSDDVSLLRQDIRGRYDEGAEAGTELQLHLRILSAASADCEAAPVAGVEVYIWHTDAQGYYSGFGNAGDQRPDEPYAGTPNQNDLENTSRFCRGVQVTDEQGVVSFRSIFPGWYNGRDVHIHFVALRPGSASRGRETYEGGDHLFTTQFYFEPELTDQVHRASEPYLRRTSLSAYEGSIRADEPNNSGLRAKATFDGTTVVAQLQILLTPP
jgi:protocatechuate 3,4-dioxygenase beta subunit